MPDQEYDPRVNPYTGVSYDDEIAASDVNPFLDVIKSPFRGIGGAVESTLELIPGVDFDENLGLGHSETWMGQLGEGISSFLTGFIPATGTISWLARASKAGKYGKLGAAAAQINKSTVIKGAVAGAVSDFAVFDGNDPRLSNLIQSVPSLANPLTEFLAAGEDDDEWFGRVKNVLEGAGLGVVAEGFMKLFRLQKDRNVLVQKTESDASGEIKAIDEEIADVASDIRDGDFDAPIGPEVPQELRAQVGEPMVFEPGATRVVGRAVPEFTYASEVLGPDAATTISQMDLHEDTAKELLKVLADAKVENADPMVKIPGVISTAVLSTKANRQLVDVIEDQFDLSGLKDKPEALEKRAKKAHAWLQRYTGQATHYYDTKLARGIAKRAGADATQLTGIRTRAVAYQQYIDNYMNDLDQLATAAENGKGFEKWIDKEDGTRVLSQSLSEDQVLGVFMEATDTAGILLTSFGRLRREIGRALRGLATHSENAGPEALEQILASKGGREGIRAFAKRVREGIKNGSAGRDLQVTRRKRVWDFTMDMFYGNLLSGIKTLTNNIIGAGGTGVWRGAESAMGAKLRAKEAGGNIRRLKGQRKKAKSLEERKAIREEVRVEAERFRASVRVAQTEVAGLEAMRHQILAVSQWVARRGWKNTDEDVPAAVQAFVAGAKERRSPLHGGRGMFDVVDQSTRDGVSRENIAQMFGKSGNELGEKLGTAIDVYADLIHLPGRGIQGSDSFLQHIAYTSYVEGQIKMQGMDKGLVGKDLDTFVDMQSSSMIRNLQALTEENLTAEAKTMFPKEKFKDPILRKDYIDDWVGQQLKDGEVTGRSAIAKEGVRIAKEIAHQTDLSKNSDRFLEVAGAHLQEFVQKIPYMRAMTPFIRTPVNLMVYGLDRTAVPGFNRDFMPMAKYLTAKAFGKKLDATKNSFIKRLMDPDPAISSAAHGQMATTMGLGVAFTSAASMGLITGRGPSDPNQRKLWQDAGWQSNSIKIGDIYVEYRKLDPLAGIIGFYANTADILRFDGGSTEGEYLEDMVLGGTMAMLGMVQDKSYLQGLTDVAALINDPERATKDVIGGLLGSLAVPAIAANLRGIYDDDLSEANTIMDRVWQRIPGLGVGVLDPKRNILGEPLDKKSFDATLEVMDGIAGFAFPISINMTRDNLLNQELAALNYPLTMASPQTLGIDMRDVHNEAGQSAYDRYVELSGLVKINGKTLRERLNAIIKTSDYRRLVETSEEQLDLESPRVEILQTWISRYRRVAKRKMMDEFPDLQDRERNRMISKHARRAGKDPSEVTGSLFPLDDN